MKKLFVAIRHGDKEAVRQMIEKKPELVACIARQPPKKDDGQSPLQVAIKTGAFEIANFLLDWGADVNFMEAEDCCNNWRAPVVHDAIMAAVMCSRWNVAVEDGRGGWKAEVQGGSQKDADEAFALLKRMIDQGADLNVVDSMGNSCAWRLCLSASQVLPSYNHETHQWRNDRILTPEIRADLSRIFDLLYENGMDDDYIRPGEYPVSVRELFKGEAVAEFFRPRK